MKNQTKAYIYALITIGLWSTIATASKLSLSFLSPAKLLMIASAVSSMVLFGVLLVQHKLPVLFSLKRGELLTSIGYGMLNPFAYYLVLFKAYDLLPAQQAQVINYTWAITLSLLSVPMLGQRVVGRQWLAIGISYTGVLVIATRGEVLQLHFEEPLGVVLALGSTIIWSLYWIFNTRDTRDPVVGLFLNFICALPFVVIYVGLTEGFGPLTLEGLVGSAYIGVCEMGVAFILWLKAMKYTDNTARIANLIFLAPFASLVFIHFFVGEVIYISTILGLLLVVGGLLVQASGRTS